MRSLTSARFGHLFVHLDCFRCGGVGDVEDQLSNANKQQMLLHFRPATIEMACHYKILTQDVIQSITIKYLEDIVIFSR